MHREFVFVNIYLSLINLQIRISKALTWSIMPYTQETKHDN